MAVIQFLNTTGLRKQGLKKFNITKDIFDKATGVFIRNPDHPVFRGHKLKTGQRWGANQPLVSLEADGAPLTPEGRVDRRFSKDFPKDMNIIADAYLFSGNRVWSLDAKTPWYGLVRPGVLCGCQNHSMRRGVVES